MEPTGWECALASGADRFIVSLAEIVSHGASVSHDVAAAAAAFWEAKAVDYNRFQRRDEEQKRKRNEAAQKQSKRRLPTLAHAAPTPTLAAQHRAEAELLEQLRGELQLSAERLPTCAGQLCRSSKGCGASQIRPTISRLCFTRFSKRPY